VVEMTHTAKALSLGSEFDAFLFAPIGEESNGMLLSVLSALARLDIDPWREAAELARMPNETAKRRLTSLIETLPDWPMSRPQPGTISTRLVALLPRGASPTIASSEPHPIVPGELKSPDFTYIVLVIVLYMFGAMGAQWASRSLHTPANLESTQGLGREHGLSTAAAGLKPGMINEVAARGVNMVDEQTTPDANDPAEQAKPKQIERQQEPQPQAEAAAQQDHHTAPGRRPLFRN
jgi:hypothetical protein